MKIRRFVMNLRRFETNAVPRQKNSPEASSGLPYDRKPSIAAEFVLEDDIVRAALDNARGRDERDLRLLAQLRQRQRAAVAHRRADLGQRDVDVVLERAGVRDIGVNAFLEGELARAAEVVALPVAGAVRAFAPVLLVVRAVDLDLVRRALVEAREVAAEHQEVGAHREGQRHVVIVDDTAVGADRDVDARLLVVAVALGADINERRSLAAADALRLARDADGAAADADLDEVRTRLSEEAEALGVDDIARADLDIAAEVLVDVLERDALPLREAFRGVDAEHIRTGLQECRDTLRVVARVDAGADDVALVLVDELELMLLVVRVVLAEDHVAQALVLVDERQHVELVIPDEVVRLRQRRRVRIRVDELLERRHERLRLRVEAHARDAVVAARHDAEELARRRAVFRDSHRRMARLLQEIQDLAERRRRLDVGVTADKTGFVVLDVGYHGSFCFNALRAVDERDTALFRECDCHLVVRDRLHDGRRHRDVHRDLRFFTFLELHQRRLERDVIRDALIRRITWDEKILSKRV